MKAFAKILVPVDFSSCSAEAVRTAADLAQHYGAELALAHVFEPLVYTTPDGYPFLQPGQLEELLATYATALDNAKQAAEAAGAARVTTHELRGFPAMEIAAFAKDGNFDLIVIGTHGRTGLKHALMGSVAEKVLRSAPCPVLCVRASAKDADPTEKLKQPLRG